MSTGRFVLTGYLDYPLWLIYLIFLGETMWTTLLTLILYVFAGALGIVVGGILILIGAQCAADTIGAALDKREKPDVKGVTS